MKGREGTWRWVVGAFGGALVLYLATLCPGYMPGESSFALQQALPDSLFPTFGNTLWHTCIGWLAALPVGTLALKAGLFSALTGAVAAGAAAHIALRIPRGETPEEQGSPVPPRQTRAIGFGATLLTFVFSPPLWFGATRALPQMFGLMCLLLLGAWTLETFHRRSPAMLNLAALLWGWIVTEYTTAWFFLIFFAAAVLRSGFSPEGHFRWRRNLRLASLFLAGALAGYTWMSLRVLGHPNAPLQDIHNLADAWWSSLKVQKNLLTQSAPPQGSLLVFLLFGGPFLLVLWPKEHATLEVRFGSILLHTVCLAINAVMLFHPPSSPWGMYLDGRLGVFMVAPSAMLALSTGYLLGYFRNLLAHCNPYLPAHLRLPRQGLRLAAPPAMAALLILSTASNLRGHNDPDVRRVNALADELAERLRGREAYVGETGFNHVLRLKLHEKGMAVRVIDLSPSLWQRETYRRILATGFADRPRLAALAEIGPSPLLQAWAESDPLFGEKVLLGDHPDLLARAGLRALPVPFGYQGQSGISQAELRELAASWIPLRKPSPLPANADADLHRASVSLTTFHHAESRRLNNLGVLLEEEGLLTEAFEAYRAARGLRPDNLSALLNLAYHLSALPSAEQESLQKEIDRVLAGLGGKRHEQWRLSEVFGHVSHPLAHMERGMTWALSGNASLAAREYENALRRAPGSEVLRLHLAQARLAGRDLDASEAEFLRVLEKSPHSPAALLGLCRIHTLRGRLDEAFGYLARLRELDAPPSLLFREEIGLLTLSGRTHEAIDRADAWIRTEPRNPRAWGTRIALATDQKDTRKIPALRASLDALLPDALPEDRLLVARLLYTRGEVSSARQWMRPLLESAPNLPGVADLGLRIAVAARDRTEAAKWVRASLTQNPSDPFATYILGTLRYHDGRLAEAESAFRTSITLGASAPALNDLASLLLESGRASEALPHAQEATRLDPHSPSSWDTLANTLLDLGDAEAAFVAQTQALEYVPEHPPFLLTLARILHTLQRGGEARPLVDRLLEDSSALTPAQRRVLSQLAKELGP